MRGLFSIARRRLLLFASPGNGGEAPGLDYDGGRAVTAYVPPGVPEAIVFAGDGQLITSGADVPEAGDRPPTMIIGAHRLHDETLRIQEYSPGESTAAFAFDPERFAAHEKFSVEDVRRWTQSLRRHAAC